MERLILLKNFHLLEYQKASQFKYFFAAPESTTTILLLHDMYEPGVNKEWDTISKNKEAEVFECWMTVANGDFGVWSSG